MRSICRCNDVFPSEFLAFLPFDSLDNNWLKNKLIEYVFSRKSRHLNLLAFGHVINFCCDFTELQ